MMDGSVVVDGSFSGDGRQCHRKDSYSTDYSSESDGDLDGVGDARIENVGGIGNIGRRSKMSADERKNRCRERNRVHARNTRERKKCQMDALQLRIQQLLDEKRRLNSCASESTVAGILMSLSGFNGSTHFADTSGGGGGDGGDGGDGDGSISGSHIQGGFVDDEGNNARRGKVGGGGEEEDLKEVSPRHDRPDMDTNEPIVDERLRSSTCTDLLIRKLENDGCIPMLESLKSQVSALLGDEEDNLDVDVELLTKDKSTCSTSELEMIRRERNRMHAKKTRMRKKKMIQEMELIIAKLEAEVIDLKRGLNSMMPSHEGAAAQGTALSSSSPSSSSSSSSAAARTKASVAARSQPSHASASATRSRARRKPFPPAVVMAAPSSVAASSTVTMTTWGTRGHSGSQPTSFAMPSSSTFMMGEARLLTTAAVAAAAAASAPSSSSLSSLYASSLSTSSSSSSSSSASAWSSALFPSPTPLKKRKCPGTATEGSDTIRGDYSALADLVGRASEMFQPTYAPAAVGASAAGASAVAALLFEHPEAKDPKKWSRHHQRKRSREDEPLDMSIKDDRARSHQHHHPYHHHRTEVGSHEGQDCRGAMDVESSGLSRAARRQQEDEAQKLLWKEHVAKNADGPRHLFHGHLGHGAIGGAGLGVSGGGGGGRAIEGGTRAVSVCSEGLSTMGMSKGSQSHSDSNCSHSDEHSDKSDNSSDPGAEKLPSSGITSSSSTSSSSSSSSIAGKKTTKTVGLGSSRVSGSNTDSDSSSTATAGKHGSLSSSSSLTHPRSQLRIQDILAGFAQGGAATVARKVDPATAAASAIPSSIPLSSFSEPYASMGGVTLNGGDPDGDSSEKEWKLPVELRSVSPSDANVATASSTSATVTTTTSTSAPSQNADDVTAVAEETISPSALSSNYHATKTITDALATAAAVAKIYSVETLSSSDPLLVSLLQAECPDAPGRQEALRMDTC